MTDENPSNPVTNAPDERSWSVLAQPEGVRTTRALAGVYEARLTLDEGNAWLGYWLKHPVYRRLRIAQLAADQAARGVAIKREDVAKLLVDAQLEAYKVAKTWVRKHLGSGVDQPGEKDGRRRKP